MSGGPTYAQILEGELQEICDALGCDPRTPGAVREALLAVERITRERDEARRKAESFARDWYEAKSEFGTAMAKRAEALRAAEARELAALAELDEVRAERDEARRKLGAALAALALIEGEAGAAVRAGEDGEP